ncbi:unnamed protein product [Cylindrotheca closterium]|uniref:Uncharacterized protein n=1 Tax=Cylindrotheca closterium TaxID=2856 RepID=A0AAD2PWW3_9STRA|nr:unnamed protein product [Cylindrotheca closterium]
MSAAEEQFIIEEEWLEEDFIGGAAYEEVVVEDVEVPEVKLTNPLQRSLSSADFSFDGSTIVEFDLGSYNGESSSGEGEPDNYEEACRKLIELVYPQGGSHDVDDMIRRCDLRNLYRNLKHQHKFLIHTKKTLAESDGKLERWESFDDSNGAFSVEAVDQAIIAFGEPPNEGEIQHKQGINDEQKWPYIEDFANPWESTQHDELSTENPSKNDDPIIGSAAVEVTQDQVMLKPQSESSAAAQLIPWLERNADDPYDYDAACRELIPLVCKGEDESDPDKMLRRSDPKDLYRQLKHQHWYLVHAGAMSEIAFDNQISNYDKRPLLDEISVIKERDGKIQGEMQEKSQDTGESAERSQDVNAMDLEPPAHIIRGFRNSVEQRGAVHGTAKIPAATLGEIPDARTNKQQNMTSNSKETEDEEEVEIIKWLDRYVDEPDDYEEASRKLLALLYSEDEECDAETTMSRSSPKELYRYLKQQYWYRMHMGTLSENTMGKGLQMSHTTSEESTALLERNKLVATVKNRISLIESTGVGEMYQHQSSSVVSPGKSSPAGTFAVATQMAIEPQVGQHPQSSELILEADDPIASGKSMQQLSSLMIEDEVVGADDMDSFEASSSLEPPRGHHSQILIDYRKERSDRPDNAEHHETQNTQNQGISMHIDPTSSSVHSDKNSSSDIQMKTTLPQAILDQVNEDEMPKLGEQHQVGRETREIDTAGSHADVQPFLHGPTLSDRPLNHSNDGTLETGSGLENPSTELNSDRSRFRNTGLQKSKRTGFTDSVRRHSSKRAKSEVGAPSGGIHNSGKPLIPGKHERFQYSSGQTRSPLNHQDKEFMKLISEAEKDLNDSFESEAIEALKFASLQIANSKRVEAEFSRPFVFSTLLAKGITDGSVIKSASKHFRDGVDFPPDYTCALKRAATIMLDEDADSSKIGNSVVNVETMVEEQRRMWENGSFSSNGGEENAGKQLSAHHDPGTRTRRINANIDNTNANLQVGAVLGSRESREATIITGRSAANKDISSSLSSPSSPANLLWQEDMNQVEHTITSSTFDPVEMTKRQHRIEEELFYIVSDAENILGDPISEEILAALILAATKSAHRKRYDNFAKDTIVYLPSVAKAVLDNGLLDDAARHFGNNISSQCIIALKAASEKAVDRSLDYKYIESRAVTLNITFPDATIQRSKMSQSNLQSKDDVVAPKTSQAENELTSVTDECNGANADVSNLFNDRTHNNEDEEGLGSTDLMELEEKAELQLAHYRDTKECLLKEYAEREQEMSIDKERIAQELDSLAGSHGLEQSRGDWNEASPNKAALARELRQLRETLLASEKERIEKERNHPSSAIGGDKNTGLFGMFGVQRRAMDLEKEKEQQAKLMQQQIREMELEHHLTQIEREIATVQQKYDNLRDKESAKTVEIADSSLSSNQHLYTKRGSLLQKSPKLEETFLEAKKRLNALENSRRDDKSWYWTEERATMAKSEGWNNGLNQQWTRSTDLKSLALVDISESPVSPGPDKLFIAAAMEEMEAIAEQQGSEPSLKIQQNKTDDREEHYRQEFMELLECDDKGESVDEDRLYHLQLYARRRVGEELSTSERFNLEEFERKEAKLENEESSNCSVDPDRERKNPVDLQKAPSLGCGSRNEVMNEGESSSTKGEEEKNHPPVLQQKKMEELPSMQGHPLAIALSRNWSPKNQKSLPIEQANLSKAFVRELGDEMMESQDVSKETDTLVSSKAVLPIKTDINEKKSRKEILAAKQVVELRRAKWGIQNEKNANSNEKKKSNDATSPSGSGASRLVPSMNDKKRKEKMAESKWLAEKTAKTREARLARETELQKCTEQVKQKGRILSANLEKQCSAEEHNALSSLNIKKGTYVLSNGSIHQELSQHPLLVHLVKEVGRLSSFISRYEKKLETTCKSILSVAQRTSQEVDLKCVPDLGLPDMYNYIADQPWFKELTSEDFSWPVSMSKRRNKEIVTSHLLAFNNPDDYVAADSSRPNDQANSRMYALSNLGKQFIKIDGPGAGDTRRFLTSLGSGEGWSKQQIVEIWSDIARLSGDDQSDRISKNIEHIMSFCLSSGFIG